MGRAFACLTSAAALAVLGTGAASQMMPEAFFLRQHTFLSAPVDFAQYRRILYQVCNHSTSRSAFRWDGAGFAVDSLAMLRPEQCAYKDRITSHPVGAVASNVTFQSAGSGDGLTWIPCWYLSGLDFSACETSSLSAFYTVASRLFTFIDGPTDTVSLSSIEAGIVFDEERGVYRMELRSSGHFDHVIIVFPTRTASRMAFSRLSEAVQELGGDVVEFIDVAADFEAESRFLVQDIEDSAATFSLPLGVGGVSETLNFDELEEIGSWFAMFGVVEGVFAVRDEVIVD